MTSMLPGSSRYTAGLCWGEASWAEVASRAINLSIFISWTEFVNLCWIYFVGLSSRCLSVGCRNLPHPPLPYPAANGKFVKALAQLPFTNYF